MESFPECLFELITLYAYGQKITQRSLSHDLNKVLAVQDAVDDLFLSPCVWCNELQEHVPNPYRNFFPYHPTFEIHRASIFGNLMLCIGHTLKSEYFMRVRSYRQVFLRYASGALLGQFHAFNQLLSRYASTITLDDLEMPRNNAQLIIWALDFSTPVAPRFLF